MHDCSDCNFAELMPDGSLFCAVRDECVHSGMTCDLWCNNLLIDVSKEEYAPRTKDRRRKV